MTSLLRRLFGKLVTLREGEAATALLMFAYSFLAMTSYNILKPITRSKFITALGADNLPYVQLAAGVLIGVLMQLYSQAIARLPRRWVIPVTQAGGVAVLVLFWFLFRTGATVRPPRKRSMIPDCRVVSSVRGGSTGWAGCDPSQPLIIDIGAASSLPTPCGSAAGVLRCGSFQSFRASIDRRASARLCRILYSVW